MQKRFLLWLLLLMSALHAGAQQQIKGQVFDGTLNEPLIGASIQVPGTTIGTVADLEGNFSFTMPEGKFLIQVSMIGYKTQVVNVKGKTEIKVTLMEDAAVMEEVVVVGYGTMKKRDLSGSVSQIKSEDLMAGGAPDVAHGMQGKIAGVDVKQSDGSPGAGVSITVRGANSFTTSSQPLYIVDGMPYDGPLSMLNPYDIESIQILKNSSETSIYGIRGANGVVVIKTKKGGANKK